MKEFTFTWSIENISYSWHKRREKIVSPKFFAPPIQFSAWTLRLYPRGFENSDYLSLFLRRETDTACDNLTVNFELSCISADTSPLQARCIPETLKTFTKAEEHGFGELRFLRRHDVFGRRKALYLPKDTLTLRCRMWKDEDDNEFGESFGRTRLTIERIISVENIKPEIPMYNIVEILSEIQNKVLISINISSSCEDKLDIRIYRINDKLMKSTTLNISFVDKRTERKLCEHEIVWFGGPQNEVFRLPFSGTLQCAENDNSEASNFEFITEVVYSTGEETKIIEIGQLPRVPEYFSKYIFSYVPSGKLADYPSISKDLWNLYNDQVLCDVELKTQKKSFFVHEVVLCARSPVFLAMLTGEMKEKKNKYIEIEDISADTLEKFLFFLYTDVFEDFDAAVDLYYAADKYQVERLRLLCSSHLIENVDIDNVCESLMLADQFNDCELRRKVDDFILKNEERVFKSSSWKKFADEKSHLAVKCMLLKYEEKENQCPTEIFEKISRHPKFLDELRFLYQKQIVSDTVIKTASASFPAHKTVLCASSSIFKDLLSNDSREKSIDFIEIEDLEDDTVSRMLLFLYTNSLEDIQWDTAKKLYHASVVYQIYRLKFDCSCFLLENLRVSNACDLLLLAHEHSDDRLKSAVEDYICVYDEEIFTSDEWTKLSETNLLLSSETMRAKYKKIKETAIR
ncbi:Speckle-type POZ protein [Araneus ventricosus]|uniref:Speckle-type POZ protein n=1 Tax=Araneus ventricosus TaxID=182803 RepID=A0A4Y2LQZ3_ARAVE|nr:Speckle-type POZ protein [Araneus ventricosus]